MEKTEEHPPNDKEETMDLNRICEEWLSRLNKAQKGHYIASEKLYFWAKWNGFALVSFTVSVTLLTFYNKGDLSWEFLNTYHKLIAAFMGGASALISSYQAMYRPSERAEIHRSQASDYGCLRRKLELAFHTGDDDKIIKELNIIEHKWEIIAGNSPLTKRKIIAYLEEGHCFWCKRSKQNQN